MCRRRLTAPEAITETAWRRRLERGDFEMADMVIAGLLGVGGGVLVWGFCGTLGENQRLTAGGVRERTTGSMRHNGGANPADWEKDFGPPAGITRPIITPPAGTPIAARPRPKNPPEKRRLGGGRSATASRRISSTPQRRHPSNSPSWAPSPREAAWRAALEPRARRRCRRP